MDYRPFLSGEEEPFAFTDVTGQNTKKKRSRPSGTLPIWKEENVSGKNEDTAQKPDTLEPAVGAEEKEEEDDWFLAFEKMSHQ